MPIDNHWTTQYQVQPACQTLYTVIHQPHAAFDNPEILVAQPISALEEICQHLIQALQKCNLGWPHHIANIIYKPNYAWWTGMQTMCTGMFLPQPYSHLSNNQCHLVLFVNNKLSLQALKHMLTMAPCCAHCLSMKLMSLKSNLTYLI